MDDKYACGRGACVARQAEANIWMVSASAPFFFVRESESKRRGRRHRVSDRQGLKRFAHCLSKPECGADK